MPEAVTMQGDRKILSDSDKQRFEELWIQHKKQFFASVSHNQNSRIREFADEIVDEAFFRAMHGLQTNDDNGNKKIENLHAYFIRVLQRTILDYKRGFARHRDNKTIALHTTDFFRDGAVVTLQDKSPDPLAQVIHNINLEKLYRAVSELSPPDQKLIREILNANEDKPIFPDLAKEYGVGESVLRLRYLRAKQRLAKKLKGHIN